MKRPLEPGSLDRPVDPLAYGFRHALQRAHPCLKAALSKFNLPLGDYADARMLADSAIMDEAALRQILAEASDGALLRNPTWWPQPQPLAPWR